jgi:N-acetylneuraminic acid mutarotase
MKHYLLAAVLCGIALTASPDTSLSQQSWQVIASMNTPRFNFSMVALQNATVLAIGGQDFNLNSIGSCEIFDPASGIWTFTSPLSVPRGRGRAVVLSNGNVAIIGGQTSADVAQTALIEIYNPATNLWSNGGNLLVARQNETATYVNDSTIYVVGGLTEEGVTSECEVYNSITNTCQPIAPMQLARHDHMTTLLSNGDLLVVGGRDGGAGSDYFNECEIYNPSTNTWTVITPMEQARIAAVLAQFSDGSVLAAGGRNTPTTSAPGSELLDTSSLMWTKISPMLQPCAGSGYLMLPDDRYLMTGGQISGDWASDVDNVTTPTCEWYDRPNEKWFYAPTLNFSRDKLCSVSLHQTVNSALPTDLVMVAGGLVGIPDTSNQNMTVNPYITNTVEVLDVSENSIAYYAAHQPGGAGVNTNASSAQSRLEIEYDANSNPVLFYSSDESASLDLGIYDINGKEVIHLQSNVTPGTYQMPTSNLQLQNGVYFVHLTSASSNQIAKMIIQR